MRLLHTSDWHLGRTLHGEPLLDAQSRFVEFLVDVVRDRAVDVVLVAGDLYDRSIPPVEAIELFDAALSRLTAAGAAVVAISGNHDSATRLGFGARLLATARVHLRTEPARAGEPVLFSDDDGPVAVYALPYLEPELAWRPLGAAGPRHEAVVAAAMARVRADLSRRPSGTRAVVLAHAFVGQAGGLRVSDSERDITVGGTALVPASVFDGIHYTALGHLHAFQRPVPDRVVYSGAPLAYSFSEAGRAKSVTVVDLDATGVTTVDPVPCPVPRPLALVRGTLDSLLHDPAWAPYERHWLAVTLTDEQVPLEPMVRLRARFDGILQLTVAARRPAVEGSYRARVDGLDDLAIACRFVEDLRHRPPTTVERDLLRAAFERRRIEAMVG
jgi:exonuclease SbcD